MMPKPNDSFETARLLLRMNRTELIAAGQQKSKQTSANDLGQFSSVKRNSVALVKAMEDKMIPELMHCVTSG